MGEGHNLPQRAIQVFYSFAPEDEDLLKSLEKQLALLKQLGLITDWHSGKIQAGQETDREFERHWKSAQIILLLISANFMASKSCYNVAQRAMERRRTGGAYVIPVILRPVDWGGAPFDGLAVLPKNMRPITRWSNQDDAFLEVAKGIRQAAEELISPDG